MEKQTIYDVLIELSSQQPEAIALLTQRGEAISFSRLVNRINAVRAELIRSGIEKDHRVILALPSGMEMATLTLAVACSAIAVPARPDVSASESIVIFRQTLAKALIVSPDCDTELTKTAPSLNIPVLRLSLNELQDNHQKISTEPTLSDVALLMRTSGSTAVPKLVPITHQQLTARADKSRRLLNLHSSDRCLNLMPLYYMHGINSGLLGPLLAGGSVICPDTVDKHIFFDCLQYLSPTWYTAGTTHHLNILAWLTPRTVEHRLRFVRSGSAPLPVKALQALESKLGVPVVESLSSTETGTITSNPPDWRRKPGSVGITPDNDIALIDEQGQRILVPNKQGRLMVCGPTVVTGYEGNPELTTDNFHDGWFCTGDLGEIDEDGYLWLRGRMDDIINRGGEKISPLEIEKILLEHPAVEQALAFAVPHPTLHCDIGAAVIPKTSTLTVDEDELRNYLTRCLPSSRIPRRILLTQVLPTTASGKPLRQGAADYFGLSGECPSSPTPAATHTPPSNYEDARRHAPLLSDVDTTTSLESSLLTVWRLVLNRDDIGINDDFFDCGGDSLSAVHLIDLLEQDLGVVIPIQYLIETGSVCRLAQRLHSSAPPRDIVGFHISGTKTPIFAVCGRFGYALRLLPLGRALGSEQPFYALQPPNMDWDSVDLSTIPHFASHYIKQIMAIQSRGPYRLLGTSFGGLVVYEMALQLQSAGHDVELLAIVDTYPSNCNIDGRMCRDNPEPLDNKGSEATIEGLRVAQTHIRARNEYIMEHVFQGELTYFWCDRGIGRGQKQYFKRTLHSILTDIRFIRDRMRDRRRLWTFFATKTKIIRIPGEHGTFHLEPQFGALYRALNACLSDLDPT